MYERDRMLQGGQGRLGHKLANEGLCAVHCNTLSLNSSQLNLPRFLLLTCGEHGRLV
jgi:hypothetical protein